ncbi:MAG: hypothetical protein K9W42_06515 [Candidatus Heimdallarchaeota archaeon]|nr:hypothetical protein [Candidatus Heimdallarchaeota archaeon]
MIAEILAYISVGIIALAWVIVVIRSMVRTLMAKRKAKQTTSGEELE